MIFDIHDLANVQYTSVSLFYVKNVVVAFVFDIFIRCDCKSI